MQEKEDGTSTKKRDTFLRRCLFVRRMRLELTRPCDHYPLKVACIPISPPTRTFCAQNRTRTCTTLRLLVPETSASTNSAIWARLYFCQKKRNRLFRHPSGKRDSNPRPQPWQGCALPTELFPQMRVQR